MSEKSSNFAAQNKFIAIMPEISSLKVTNADYVRDHVLRLSFNDGVTKYVDFWPLAQKGICTKLQNMDYFRNYTLDPFSVDWSNEIGFAPEYLYEIGQAA